MQGIVTSSKISGERQKAPFHLMFWILLLAGFTLIQFFKDGNDQNLLMVFFQNLKRIPAMLFAVYTYNFFLVPNFYKRGKYVFFYLGCFFMFYLASATDRIINIYVYEPLFRKGDFEQESIREIFTNLEFLITSYLSPLLIATFIMNISLVIREKNEMERLALQLQRDKNEAELNALKAQIHPHFLFNTLNNLYALTVQKSDKAPKMVESLSFILDYVLYRCNDKFVPLQNEIELIENYISLERLRFDESMHLDITFENDPVARERTRLAPFLLLPIVENAFKHGVGKQSNAPIIQILLQVKNGIVLFDVRNSKELTKPDVENKMGQGIGLKNLREQLRKLYRTYNFEYQDQGESFHVKLKIDTTTAYD